MKTVARYCVLAFTTALFAIVVFKAQGCHAHKQDHNYTPRTESFGGSDAGAKTTLAPGAENRPVDAGHTLDLPTNREPDFLPATKSGPIRFDDPPPADKN